MKIKRLKSENGAVVVIVALSIIALMMVTALAIDVGSLYEERRHLQTVADAAALAGAQGLPENVYGDDGAIKKAIEYASNCGFIIDDDDVIISSTLAEDDTITVNAINPNAPLYFARVIGLSQTQVVAYAKAIVGSPEEYVGVVPWGLLEGDYEYGQEYTLKYGAPPELSPGNFGALGIDGTGSKIYKNSIIFGCNTPVKIGDWIGVETGNMAGPTRDGVEDRVAREPDGVWSDLDYLLTEDYDLKRPDSQFVIIPIINEWPKGSSGDVQILDFKPFIITDYSGKGGHAEVKGVFLSKALIITDGKLVGLDQTGIRIIRLIK